MTTKKKQMCVIMAEEEIIEFTCNMQMQVDAKEGKAAVWSADRKKISLGREWAWGRYKEGGRWKEMESLDSLENWS